MTELTAGNATLTFDETQCSVKLQGSMRLPNLKEYEKVKTFLGEAASTCSTNLTLDMTGLEFLNSSGITIISMFVINSKKNGKPALRILGSNTISWQDKSLRNFKKLWATVDIVMQ